MADKQITKEILLKFKGSNKGLEQEIKKTERLVQNLQRTIGSGTSDKFGKTLDGYIKASQKFGTSINKDMTRFQKTIQDISVKDLKALQRQTDALFRRTEEKLARVTQQERKLQTMQDAGASQKSIKKQQRRLATFGEEARRASSDFEESAERFSSANVPSRPSFRQRAAGFARGLGTVATGVSTVADVTGRVMDTREAAKAMLAETTKQRRAEFFQGNLTEAMLEQKDKIIQKSSEFARDRRRVEDAKKGGWGVAGVAGLAALALGTGGLGALVAGGAAIAGGVNAIPYFFGGGRQSFEEQTRREQANNLRKQTMTDYYYQFLREKAPQRYEMQRIAGMNDMEAQNFRQEGFRNFFAEEESSQTLLALRGTLGNRAGRTAARQAMEVARGQGMSLGNATDLAGNLAMTGVGGATNIKKTLTEVYSDAFSKGVTDSGLIEVFQRGLSEIAARSPDVSDITSISERMTANMEALTSGREVGIRDIRGATQAQQLLGDISMQGGLAGFSKLTDLAELTGGDAKAMAFFANRSDEEITQLIKNKDPRAMRMIGGEQNAENFLNKFGPASTLTKMLTTTQAGSDAMREMRERLQKGESVQSIAESMGGDIEVLSGTGKISKEASANLVMSALNQMATSDPDLKKQLDENQKKARISDIRNIRSAMSSAQTDEEKMQAMTAAARRFSRDMDTGQGDDFLKQLTPDQQKSVMGITQAARNARMRPEGGVSEAQRAATFEGMSELDRKAAEAISAEDVRAASATQRMGASAGLGLGQSVDQLKSALDSFVRALESQNPTGSSQSATGVSYGM